MEGIYHTHHQAQVLQHPHYLLPHIHPTPWEGSVPTALQCPNLQVPQQPLKVCPIGCFACPSIALLVLRQPGHGAIAGRREGGERVPPASTGFLSATGGSRIPSPTPQHYLVCGSNRSFLRWCQSSPFGSSNQDG